MMRDRGTDDNAPGNAVTNRKHLADLLELDLAAIVHDLGLDDGRKLRRGRRILLGRCARAGGTRESKSAALLHDRPNFARGRFGGGAQSGEGGALIRGTSGASPVPLSERCGAGRRSGGALRTNSRCRAKAADGDSSGEAGRARRPADNP